MSSANLYPVQELSTVATNKYESISSDQVIANLLHSIPGIKSLSILAPINPMELSVSARIDFLTALERQAAWLQALLQRAIVAIAGDESSSTDKIWDGVDEAEREDIATALRLSPNSAQLRIDVARTLVNHLPNTCAALAMGEISASHATVIAKETAAAIRDGLSESAIYEVESKALSFAEFHTPRPQKDHHAVIRRQP